MRRIGNAYYDSDLEEVFSHRTIASNATTVNNGDKLYSEYGNYFEKDTDGIWSTKGRASYTDNNVIGVIQHAPDGAPLVHSHKEIINKLFYLNNDTYKDKLNYISESESNVDRLQYSSRERNTRQITYTSQGERVNKSAFYVVIEGNNNYFYRSYENWKAHFIEQRIIVPRLK